MINFGGFLNFEIMIISPWDATYDIFCDLILYIRPVQINSSAGQIYETELPFGPHQNMQVFITFSAFFRNFFLSKLTSNFLKNRKIRSVLCLMKFLDSHIFQKFTKMAFFAKLFKKRNFCQKLPLFDQNIAKTEKF